MKKLCLVLCLFGMVPAFGQSRPTTWITLGSDALNVIAAEFEDRKWSFDVTTNKRGDVAIMSATEDQLIAISRLMHASFNRCGGFIAHASFEEALTSAESAAEDLGSKRALSYTLDRATAVTTVLPSLSEAQIVSTITSLSGFTSRYYTTQTSVDAANWLKTQWETMASGRSDISVQLYPHAGWAMPSVVMTITGAHQPQDIVVMGGHLDSINSSGSFAPGADDDASGIATLSEIARAALSHGYVPSRTIKIIGYAAEEVGLRGSAEIAQAAVNNGDNVIGVLQLDMTNYKGSALDIYLMQDYTNAAQNTFVGTLISTYTTHTFGTSTCGYGCSDHASWHNRGFAASMPFESTISQYNPFIHTANDTLAVSGNNAAHAIKFARMGAAYMIEMGKGGLNGNPGVDPGPVNGDGFVLLKSDDFEAGMGSYSDGGTDCRRSINDASYAHQGSYCVQLRDDTTSARVSLTNALSLAGATEVKVSFWAITNGMETGESFHLDYYNGSTWLTVANWVVGTQVTNNVFINPTVVLSGSSYAFTNTAKFRFRADGSDDTDTVHFDEIAISRR